MANDKNAFEAWFNTPEGESIIRNLDDPVKGIEPDQGNQKNVPELPPETPDWVRKLLEEKDTNPKFYQIQLLIRELRERINKGSLLKSGDTPEQWITVAEQLSPDDLMRDWNLRQATTEYLILAANGDRRAVKEAKVLLARILDEDMTLARELYPQLIDMIKE